MTSLLACKQTNSLPVCLYVYTCLFVLFAYFTCSFIVCLLTCLFICLFVLLAFFFFQTPEEYEREYARRLQTERYQLLNLTEFVSAGTEFDGIWAMALGLHEASERVRVNDSSGCEGLEGRLVPLENFTYLNDRMGCVLRRSFQQVSFLGITVSVIGCFFFFGHSIKSL